MPYYKRVGHTPRYVPRVISRTFTSRGTAIVRGRLNELKIPHETLANTIMFKDCYEAYIDKFASMTPFQRFLETVL